MAHPSDTESARASPVPTSTTPVPPAGTAHASSGGVLRLTSLAIFAGAQEVEIEHKGAVYRLRQTSLGKLILTK